MKWFGRKQRRDRGPYTPQARALNWATFLTEAEARLRKIGVPESAWSSQEAFESFLRTGTAPTGQRWERKGDEAERELRELTWAYRDRTKQRFGASFQENDDEGVGAWTAAEILRELAKSSRWGANEQPLDLKAIADVLASLPIFSANMKREDTLLLRFLRPLTDAESERLLSALGYDPHDEAPFVPGDPRLSAYCWWD